MEFIKDWKVAGALQRPKVMTRGSKRPREHLKAAPTDVELCEVARALELVDKFRNEGQWSGVFDGDVIEVTIVLDGSEAVALFFDKEKGASDRGL